jgi:hypothetical protein
MQRLGKRSQKVRGLKFCELDVHGHVRMVLGLVKIKRKQSERTSCDKIFKKYEVQSK